MIVTVLFVVDYRSEAHLTHWVALYNYLIAIIWYMFIITVTVIYYNL